MRIRSVLWAGTIWPALFHRVCATFSDEAYNIDFHHALLGIPQPHSTFFHKPELSATATLLYTLSDKGVLGAVNPRDGSLVWRQAIAGQPVENITDALAVAGDGGSPIITAYNDTLNAWDAGDGRLVWSHKVADSSKITGLQLAPTAESDTFAKSQGLIFLTEPQEGTGVYAVSKLDVSNDGSNAVVQHKSSDAKGDTLATIATSPKHIFYITQTSGILSGQKTKVTVLNFNSLAQEKEYTINLSGEMISADGQKVAASCSGTPFLITSEKSYKTLKVNLLGSSKVFTLILEDKGEEIISVRVHSACGANSAAHFLVDVQTESKSWAEIYHIDPVKSEISKAYSLPALSEHSTFAASSNAQKVFFTRVTDTEVSVHSSDSHGHLARWPRKKISDGITSSAIPVHAVAEIASRDTSSVAVRVAIVSREGSWSLIRDGHSQWSRPEVLAHATLATWVDDVKADALLHEFESEVSADPATAYINRAYRHAQELVRLPIYLAQLPTKIFSPTIDEISARQGLIGSKSLIVATSRKSLLSLNDVDGKIQWATDLKSSLEGDISYLSCEDGRVTLYTSDGSVAVVNSTTGDVIEKKSGTVSSAQLIVLPGSPASTVIKIDKNGNPSYASDLAPSVPTEGNAIVTLNKNGEVLGWTVGSTITQTWSFKPSNVKIISIAGRPIHDPIASIGKVLGDRSVYYKFVSPNLAVLTGISESSTMPSLTIYLIDMVTGAVLHTSTHSGILASAPISAALSENWFAYTFTASEPHTSGLSTQLIISELYESSVPNDRGTLSTRTNYSSFDPDALSQPHVMSLAYTLSEPIQNLTVTQTAQGITSRMLLAYLSQNNAVAAIPMHILNARRTIDRDPNSNELEEGLFRYQPNLELDPKFFLSHAREVMGVKKILTAPTLLESTSMVFALGHDVFGTQSAPSQTFDVLGKSFNRLQLILTVVALYIGVVVIRPIVRRKVVERGWL